jgi:hypothetical protein
MKIRYSIEEKRSILDKQIAEKIPNEMISITYGIDVSTLYYWKKSLGYDLREDVIEERKKADFISVQFQLRGNNKSYFLEDCLRRDWPEARMARQIFDFYYSIMSNRPDLQGKEMTEIKTYILKNIPL